MEGARRGALRAGGFILVGAVVGSLLGPPIASAVGTLVTIEGAGSTNKAKVTKAGRLQVDTGGVSTQNFPCGPGKTCTALTVNTAFGQMGVTGAGATVIASGTASGSAPCGGSVQAVTVDNNTASASAVAISGLKFGGGSLDVWQGTVPATSHINDTFGTAGVGYMGPLIVTESGGAAKWYVYGNCFGPGPGKGSKNRR